MQVRWVKIGDCRQITRYNSKTSTVASVDNLLRLHKFITLSVHLCLQHVCCDTAHRAGSSTTADTYRYGQSNALAFSHQLRHITTIFWSQQVITAVIIINSILLFLLCPGMQTMKNSNVRNRHKNKKRKMVFEYNKQHSNPYLIFEYSVVALTHSQFKITHH